MVMNALLVAGMAALVGASPALSGYTGNNPGRLIRGPPRPGCQRA